MSTTEPAAVPGPRSRSRSTTFDLVVTALLAAIIAALGVAPPISVGVLGVPITLQTLGVMLAGVLLGPARGAAAAALVVLLALVGLPILSGGRGGLGVLFGPTGGYLLGWIPGALVVGLLARFWASRRVGTAARTAAFAVSALVGGVGVVYAAGIPWTAVVAGVPLTTAAVGALPFVPGDVVKAVLAAVVAVAVHRGYRRLL